MIIHAPVLSMKVMFVITMSDKAIHACCSTCVRYIDSRIRVKILLHVVSLALLDIFFVCYVFCNTFSRRLTHAFFLSNIYCIQDPHTHDKSGSVHFQNLKEQK